MNCIPFQDGDVCGWLTPGPTVELKREPAGDLWCFGCRKRLPHDHVLMGDEGVSYYDPSWSRRCSRCGKDQTTFPGSVW